MNIKDTLSRLGQGAVAEELENVLRQACQTAIGRDGKAEVSLKLSISPNGTDGVTIESTVAMKSPNVRHAKTFLFLDDDGDLSVTDPKQMTLGAPVGP